MSDLDSTTGTTAPDATTGPTSATGQDDTAAPSSPATSAPDQSAPVVSGPPSDPATAPVPSVVDPGPNPTPADPTVNQAPEPTPVPPATEPTSSSASSSDDEDQAPSVKVGDVVTYYAEDTFGNAVRGYGLVTEIFEDKRQGLDGKWSDPADYARIAALPDAGIVALDDLNPDD